ncbi:hypothetical protein BDR05DRAFT_955052, partial [Suillus weaverae]
RASFYFALSTSTTVVSGIGEMSETAMSLPIIKFVWLPVTLICVYSPSLMNSACIKGET